MWYNLADFFINELAFMHEQKYVLLVVLITKMK